MNNSGSLRGPSSAQPSGAALHENECKGCDKNNVRVPEKQLKRILDSLSSRPDQCVDDETYEERLRICRACPSLAYDTTCMHCGCLVAIRAKMKDKGCPYPLNPKW